MLESMVLSGAQRAALEKMTATYAEQLDEATIHYLVGRGVTKEAALGHRLGSVVEPLPGHEQYVGRLVIPYLTPAGVVSLKFRDVAGGNGPKYMGLPGQHPRLYNVMALHKGSDYIAIVEGEMDALVMDALVGVPAVGVPGASTWLPHMPRCFADYDRVFVVCDNDKSKDDNPGQRLAKKIAEDIRGCVVIPPPEDQDVNEWFLSSGADAIRKRMGLP